jgi:hypothetical protein
MSGSYGTGKYSIDIETMIPEGLRMYGALCGWTPAGARPFRGPHCVIAAYLGNSDVSIAPSRSSPSPRRPERA